MIAPFLCLGLIAQGGPAHADLHPLESDLYVEVGHLPTLWGAYEQAPLVKLLRDEKVQGLLRGLDAELDPTPRTLAERALESALGAEADGWFPGLESLSASLVATGASGEGVAPYAFTAIADFSEPAQAEALKKTILERAPEHEPRPGPLPGVELIRLPHGEQPIELWCTALGKRLVIGAGSATVEAFVERTEQKRDGLGKKEDFQEGLAAFEKGGGASCLWFAQGRPILDIARALHPEGGDAGIGFLEKVPAGMNPFAAARTARVRLAGERFVTEVFTPRGADARPAVFGAKPLDRAWLEPVSKDAMLFWSSALDGEALGKSVRALIATDEASTSALAAIEEKLGFGPERLLQRLGPAFTFYAFPVAGPALPETRVWVDCNDPAAFQADLEAFVGALGELLPGLSVRTRPYKLKNDQTGEKTEVPVTAITLPASMGQLGMLSPSPSFAAVGKKLVFALNSMDVKSELKRMLGGEGEPLTAGADPLAARGFELPEDARSVVVMDWGMLLAGVLNMVKAFAGMGADALPFDVTSLPPADLFTAHLRPTFHYSRHLEGAVYRRNEGSFGPEVWLGIIAGAARWGGQGISAAPPDTEEISIPATDGDEPK